MSALMSTARSPTANGSPRRGGSATPGRGNASSRRSPISPSRCSTTTSPAGSILGRTGSSESLHILTCGEIGTRSPQSRRKRLLQFLVGGSLDLADARGADAEDEADLLEIELLDIIELDDLCFAFGQAAD